MAITLYKKAFTIIEVIVVTAVTVLAATLIISGFYEINRSEALKKNTGIVAAAIDRARELTLSSQGASQYGVHIASGSVVIFKGTIYSAGATGNITESLGSLATISSTSIQGGSDIIFERLTGKTANTGTIGLVLSTDPTKTKTITIYSTGIVETN